MVLESERGGGSIGDELADPERGMISEKRAVKSSPDNPTGFVQITASHWHLFQSAEGCGWAGVGMRCKTNQMGNQTRQSITTLENDMASFSY